MVLIGSMVRDGGIPQEVERKIIHKRYNPETHENDIALIKVNFFGHLPIYLYSS